MTKFRRGAPLPFVLAGAVLGLTVLLPARALPTTMDVSSADLTILGDDAQDSLGAAAAAGDINADGTDDLIITAYGGDPPGRTNAGETYVFWGGADLPSVIDLNVFDVSPDLTVLGESANDFSGIAAAAGDLNGDSIEEGLIYLTLPRR